MDSKQLAQRVIHAAQRRAYLTEPLLIIDGERYTAAQVETMLSNGDLLRMDGLPPDARPRYQIPDDATRYWAASSFVTCVQNAHQGRKVIQVCVWPPQDEPAPEIEVIAPDDWQVLVIRIEWVENWVGIRHAAS